MRGGKDMARGGRDRENIVHQVRFGERSAGSERREVGIDRTRETKV